METLGEIFLLSLTKLAKDQADQQTRVTTKGESDVRLGADYMRNNKINNVMFELKKGILLDQKKIIQKLSATENFDNIYNAIQTDIRGILTHKEHTKDCFRSCSSLTLSTQNLIKEYCEWINSHSLSDNCPHDGLKNLDAFYREHCADNWESYVLKQNRFAPSI